MEQALPLDFESYDPQIEITGDISSLTAEQYLSWVRKQAENLPGVVRAQLNSTEILNIQSPYMPEIDDIPSCPIEFIPSEEWIRDIIHSFSELRMSLYSLGQMESSKERIIVVY